MIHYYLSSSAGQPFAKLKAGPGLAASIVTDPDGLPDLTISATANLGSAETDTAVAPGQPLCLLATGHLTLARADSAATTRIVGLAAAAAAPTTAAQYIEAGNVTLDDWTAVTGTASLTVGAVYYLSSVTAGQLTPTAPTTGGSYVAAVGTAIGAQTLNLSVQPTVAL